MNGLRPRLEATGGEAPALVDFIMSKDCPVYASLTDADRANLLLIKRKAIEAAAKATPKSVMSEAAYSP
jgi:hypothetical protein